MIKRYSNRKLYNVETGQYVTLEEIGQMVRRGEDVQVMEHATGADITTLVLMQVIFEQEKRLGGIFPRVLLSQAICARDKALRLAQTFFEPRQYLAEEVRRRFKILAKEGKLAAESAEELAALLLDSRFDQEEGPPSEEEAIPARQVQDLLRQLEEIEQKIKELSH